MKIQLLPGGDFHSRPPLTFPICERASATFRAIGKNGTAGWWVNEPVVKVGARTKANNTTHGAKTMTVPIMLLLYPTVFSSGLNVCVISC